ncbi:CBS domain-containing protein [Amycolatopsis taiwanensis]|uniref:CBS domain-containing protein n=1 Tax=Amycolatopsis taiwanensis TaxID=342230 RepID=A0A9W6RAK4_9PSEU|nr:CBS domain-containing protein [Amycolatopsis taiwanensis]GLY70557.1 CBS domain-containing protein [Amycolatopsis taiwanensis]
MKVRDIMSAAPVTVTPSTPVATAEELLAQQGFTALPVTDHDGNLVGIVTEADFIADRFPGEVKPAARRVEDVMSRPVRSVEADIEIALLARIMLDHRLRSLPVVDRGKLIGVVTRHDFLRVLTRPDHLVAADLLQRLGSFGGPDRWTVDVRGGEATIIDRFDIERDRQVATILAESVPGVVHARCYAARVDQG